MKRGLSQTAIAYDIAVHRSTISRELRRNSGKTGYYYHWAQAQAEDRQRKRRSRPRKMTAAVVAFIEGKLKEGWSPQQISGWLKYRQNELPVVSHERIYQHVWRNKWNGGRLHLHLRHRGRRYCRRGSCYGGRGRIPGRVDIHQRPAIVERKARLGDWELDTIVGAQHRGALVSMAERRSKLVRLALVRSCKADEVARAIARHADFGRALQADTFFAKPYQAWQRGLNEHSNGLVRQYFPKSIDFTTVSSDDVRRVEALLNTRPRAVLVSLIDRFVEQLNQVFMLRVVPVGTTS